MKSRILYIYIYIYILYMKSLIPQHIIVVTETKVPICQGYLFHRYVFVMYT